MSTTTLPTKAQFDRLFPELQRCADEWAEEECTSFDAAVLDEVEDEVEGDGGGSIWDMPTIDSKRVVALLVRLEKVMGTGYRIPVSVIKSGGYANKTELVGTLLGEIRGKCADALQPGLVSAIAGRSKMKRSVAQ